MIEQIDVVPVRRMTGRTIGGSNGAMHLLTFTTESDNTITFGINNDELSRFVVFAQDMLSRGIEYEFNAE